MEKLTVVKVGGAVVEDPHQLQHLLDRFARIDGLKVLVHGGGRSATSLASRLGIETQMIDGRRVTDTAMLCVVTMVYGGLINKDIVANLQARGLNAIGVTGADLDLIHAHKRPITAAGVDYGLVGDVDRVNSRAFGALLSTGATPVVAPLTHDGQGHLLNTNADTIAASVARGLAADFAVELVYCFEKAGVLVDPDDDTTVIPVINRDSFGQLVGDGTVSGGMIPKIENALAAVGDGVKSVTITSVDALGDQRRGTRVMPG